MLFRGFVCRMMFFAMIIGSACHVRGQQFSFSIHKSLSLAPPANAVTMASLRPNSGLVWKRTSPPSSHALTGPVLYAIIFRSSATPGQIPKIAPDYTLTNSLISEDNSGVHVGGLVIDPTGALTLCCGQSFGGTGTVTNVTADLPLTVTNGATTPNITLGSLSNSYVDLTTSQIIAGLKTFNNTVTITTAGSAPGMNVTGGPTNGTGINGTGGGTGTGVSGTGGSGGGHGVVGTGTGSGTGVVGVAPSAVANTVSGTGVYAAASGAGNSALIAEGQNGAFSGKFKGTIVKSYDSGTTYNQAIPIAYGTIKFDGTVWTATPNVSSFWDGAANHNYYQIAIAGENYIYQNYITVVTPGFGCYAGTQLGSTITGNGNLIVSFQSSSPPGVQCNFSFVTYKP